MPRSPCCMPVRTHNRVKCRPLKPTPINVLVRNVLSLVSKPAHIAAPNRKARKSKVKRGGKRFPHSVKRTRLITQKLRHKALRTCEACTGKQYIIVSVMLIKQLFICLLIVIGIRIVHFIAGFAVGKYGIIRHCVRKIHHCPFKPVF